MSDFGSNGHLHPILHACVASLIMNMMEMLCATSTKRTETEAAPSSFMLNYVNRLFKHLFMIPMQRAGFRTVRVMMQSQLPH
jgi:hypothetical protein